MRKNFADDLRDAGTRCEKLVEVAQFFRFECIVVSHFRCQRMRELIDFVVDAANTENFRLKMVVIRLTRSFTHGSMVPLRTPSTFTSPVLMLTRRRLLALFHS